MKHLKSLLSVIALTAVASSASALTTVTFTQEITDFPSYLAKLDDDWSGNANGDSQKKGGYYADKFTNIIDTEGNALFDFLKKNSAICVITEAVVDFAFADDSSMDSSEKVEISVFDGSEKTKIFDYEEVDGNHSNPPVSYDVKSKQISKEDLLEDLSESDGDVEFKVKADKGDFYLKSAKITVTVECDDCEPPTHSVPDSGTTAGLLGLAVLGLAAVRRKLS